jgi:CPA2 family monovalent cation:H+ antiporter-2
LSFERRRVETPRIPQPAPSTGAESAAQPHSIVVGYGRVGRVVAERLRARNIPIVVIEDQDQVVAAARTAGIEVLHGNAADAKNLADARVAGANRMFVAIPNGFEAGQIVEQAKAANANLVVVARAHSQEEFDHLQRLGATKIVLGERELGLAMVAAAAASPGAAAT